MSLTRLKGFEPLTFGSVDRRSKAITVDSTKSCDTVNQQLTPQLTPESPKQPKIDTSDLPSDLTEIVAAWPELAAHIKAAIKALVQTHNTENR